MGVGGSWYRVGVGGCYGVGVSGWCVVLVCSKGSALGEHATVYVCSRFDDVIRTLL